MSKAIETFEALQDSSLYIVEGYLKSRPSSKLRDDLTYINGAISYILANELFRENAGSVITKEASDAIEGTFEPKRLADEAVALTDFKKDPGLLIKDAQFPKYFRFIAETEEYVNSALEDDLGKWAISYINRLIEAIVPDLRGQGIDPLKVSEVVFLNATYSVYMILRGELKQEVIKLKSFPYFDIVSSEAERIRREILE